LIAFARSFALDKAGSNMAARIAIMAMTTSSSIRVKARKTGRLGDLDIIVAMRRFSCLGDSIDSFDRH
jgi:hypothetical protein